MRIRTTGERQIGRDKRGVRDDEGTAGGHDESQQVGLWRLWLDGGSLAIPTAALERSLRG